MYLKSRLDLYFNKQYGAVLLLVGIVIIGLGAYIALSPPTYTVQDTVDERTYRTTIQTESVTQSRNSNLYRYQEPVVNANRYFIPLHPDLTLNPTTSAESQSTQNISPTNTFDNTTIQMSAETTRGDSIWDRTYSAEKTDWINKNSNNSQLSIDITMLMELITELQIELPTNSVIILDISTTSTVTSPDSLTQDASVRIQFPDNQSYSVTYSDAEETVSQSETVSRVQTSQAVTIGSDTYGINGLLISVFGVLILSLGSYLTYGALFSDRDYDERLYKYHQYKYSSWISNGRPYTDPEFDQEWEQIKVDTLEDLVELAIDSDERIIYYSDVGRYYVFDAGTLYIFTKPSGPNHSVNSGNGFQAFNQ